MRNPPRLNHGKIDFGRQAQSVAHQVAENRFAIVGDGNRWGLLRSAKVGQHSALAGVSGSGDGEDVDHCAALRALDPRDPSGESTTGCVLGMQQTEVNLRPRLRRFRWQWSLYTLAGFAQVDMQVDEAGSRDQPARVELVVCRSSKLAGRRDFRDLPIASRTSMRRRLWQGNP